MSTKLMRIHKAFRRAMLAGTLIATVSCGDVVRSTNSPVMLVLSSLTAGTESTSILGSDVLTRVATPPPCTASTPCYFVRNDFGNASFSLVPKNPTIAPTANNSVTISRYHVEYRRADGNNRPGIDVPFPFDGAVTLKVDSTGSVGFELVRVAAKEESPLIELRSNSNVLSTLAEVTFFGTDVVGNDVSASGSISVNFADYGP